MGATTATGDTGRTRPVAPGSTRLGMDRMTTQAEPDEHYKKELLGLIQEGIDKHPRSAQSLMGPSEAGDVCERKIAWKLAYGGASNRPGGYAAAKGTIVHAWLDQEVFGVSPLTKPDGSPRFMSDLKLKPMSPLIAGGTLDLYDSLHATVVDFKIPGDATMEKARSGNMSPTYLAQIQIYGTELKLMGYPVSKVGLLFLPMCGDSLHNKAVYRYWNLDESIAWGAIKRIERIQNMLQVAPPQKVLEVLPTASSFCQSCSAFSGSGDRRAMCPGATPGNRSVNSSKDPFAR